MTGCRRIYAAARLAASHPRHDDVRAVRPDRRVARWPRTPRAVSGSGCCSTAAWSGPATRPAFDFLRGRGVEVVWSSRRYFATHEKTFVIDRAVAVVMSLNLTAAVLRHQPRRRPSSTTIGATSLRSSRSSTPTSAACSDRHAGGRRPGVEPGQSGADLVALVEAARRSIDVESEELSSRAGRRRRSPRRRGEASKCRLVDDLPGGLGAGSARRLAAAGGASRRAARRVAALHPRQAVRDRRRDPARAGVRRLGEPLRRLAASTTASSGSCWSTRHWWAGSAPWSKATSARVSRGVGLTAADQVIDQVGSMVALLGPQRPGEPSRGPRAASGAAPARAARRAGRRRCGRPCRRRRRRTGTGPGDDVLRHLGRTGAVDLTDRREVLLDVRARAARAARSAGSRRRPRRMSALGSSSCSTTRRQASAFASPWVATRAASRRAGGRRRCRRGRARPAISSSAARPVDHECAAAAAQRRSVSTARPSTSPAAGEQRRRSGPAARRSWRSRRRRGRTPAAGRSRRRRRRAARTPGSPAGPGGSRAGAGSPNGSIAWLARRSRDCTVADLGLLRRRRPAPGRGSRRP